MTGIPYRPASIVVVHEGRDEASAALGEVLARGGGWSEARQMNDGRDPMFDRDFAGRALLGLVRKALEGLKYTVAEPSKERRIVPQSGVLPLAPEWVVEGTRGRVEVGYDSSSLPFWTSVRRDSGTVAAPVVRRVEGLTYKAPTELVEREAEEDEMEVKEGWVGGGVGTRKSAVATIVQHVQEELASLAPAPA